MTRRIKEERNKKGWNQEELAEKLGISSSYYGKIERGDRTPSDYILYKMEELFGMPYTYLMEDEDGLQPTQEQAKEEGKMSKKESKKEKRNGIRVKRRDPSEVTKVVGSIINTDCGQGKLAYSIIMSFPKKMKESGLNRRIIVNLYEHGVTVNVYKTNGVVVEYCNMTSPDNQKIVKALETTGYKLQADLSGCYDIKCDPTIYANVKVTKGTFVEDENFKGLTLRDIMTNIGKIYED